VLSGRKFLMAKLSIKITAGEETSASLSSDWAEGGKIVNYALNRLGIVKNSAAIVENLLEILQDFHIN
jgi:hypothetical protein